MIYELPFDLYEDWKALTYTKELFENIVKELKEQKALAERSENDHRTDN